MKGFVGDFLNFGAQILQLLTVIVPYLDTGWSRPQLEALFAAADLTPRDALRTTKSPAEELGLLNDDVSDDALLDAMVAHPILVNRPIVVTRKGTALCRPADKVLDLLERWPDGPFYKENGEVILDADGRRV